MGQPSELAVNPEDDEKSKYPGVAETLQERSLWLVWVSIISVLLAVAIAFRPTSGGPLPPIYALCSRAKGKVYTVDSSRSQVQCILVNGSSIAAVGSVEEIKAKWKTSEYATTNLDIRFIPSGAIIIPGITDSHAHILEYGATQQLPLEGASTIQDAVARIRQYILSTPEVLNDTSKVITGGGWDHTVWPGRTWPTAADMEEDDIVRGRHIVLQSKDCHALWLSQKALDSSRPFPDSVEGGIIVRDTAGIPSGVLLDNAQELLKQPKLTDDDLLRRFKVTVRDAHRYGLTSIHDAGLDPISLDFYQRQAELGPLPLRIYAMKFFNETAQYWGNITRPVLNTSDKRLSARSVKIFADGALRTGGAALLAPYHDHASSTGFMRLDPSILYDFIPKFLRDGWQVNVHAIGDRANAIVLDAFEMALKGTNVSALRPRLEHAQMMTETDMKRLGNLGVIASIQPAHAVSDMWYAEDRLGPDRVKALYAFRTIVDSGARITLGSDFPVESINPLSGFYAAVTRLSPDGRSPHGPEGWFPNERLTRQEALRGMTIDPAYASFTEDILGSLEVGKLADFTILSQDILEIAADDILKTTVLATVIDGKFVYGNL